MLLGGAVVGCAPEEEGARCGDALTCDAGEFCLVVFPAEGEYGDQSYACKPLPAGCESFDAMCTSDPPCGDDWAETYCDPEPLSVGCVVFGGVEEAVCEQ